MTTVFYNDTTGPTALTTLDTSASMLTAIPGWDATAAADKADGVDDRIQYALYQDTATWTAYAAWTEQNGLMYENVSLFSDTAL